MWSLLFLSWAAAELVVVPLEKQDVPVYRGDRLVSSKSAYFGTVSVGTQAFQVLFDTGSGHVFVPSTRCGSPACRMHERYNESLVPREEVAINFGTGEVVGSGVDEVLCLSKGHCASMRLLAAHSMTDEPFQSFKFDGVVGLGLAGLAVGPQFSFFEQMSRQSKLLPQFGYFISDRPELPSEIAFGGADERHMRGGLQWAKVHEPSKGLWQMKVTRLLVDQEPVAFCSEGCTAICDTGTSLLAAPRAAATELHRSLARLVKQEPEDCREVDGPELTFELEGGVRITLGSREYSRPAPMKVLNKKQEPQTVCRATLLPVDPSPSLGMKAFILGEPMLRKYYTVYDWEKQRVGFALSASQPATVHV